MSQPDPAGASKTPPATAQDYRGREGFGLWFYPGFVSRCDVTTEEGKALELYRQTNVWHTPDHTEAATTNQVLFTAPGGRGFALQIDDFSKCIDRIVVHLKPCTKPGPGNGDGGGGDLITIRNSATVCPPVCG